MKRRFREPIGAWVLGGACVLLTVGGLGAVAGQDLSAKAADDLVEGRRAFAEGRYEPAFANFSAVLEDIPDSAIAAHGAACSLWRLGDGERAMIFEQMAVNYGVDFTADVNNCFGSETEE